MDRVLEAPKPRRSSFKEELRLLLPGEREWESWEFFQGQEAKLQSSVSQKNVLNELKGTYHLGIPLQHLLVVPIWLATKDASVMKEMVGLQLESKGLGKSGGDSAFDYVVVRQENERTLLAVSVLPKNFPEELCHPRILQYRPVTDYWSLPHNQVLIWRELEVLILAFTSGSELIYVQSSSATHLHESLLLEANCARLILESEGSLASLLGITFYGEFSREEMEAVSLSMDLPLQKLDHQVPANLKNARKLLPSVVYQAQKQRNQAHIKRRLAFGAAGVYLLILIAIFGQLGWLGWQKKTLADEIDSHRNEVEALRSTSQRWRALEPAVLPETYPLEILYRCTKLLPEEGVRFVNYDQSQDRVLISGEAKNALAALQYIEALKKSAELDAYVWEMPSPVLLPNESAQFRIEGKRRDATAKIQ